MSFKLGLPKSEKESGGDAALPCERRGRSKMNSEIACTPLDGTVSPLGVLGELGYGVGCKCAPAPPAHSHRPLCWYVPALLG